MNFNSIIHTQYKFSSYYKFVFEEIKYELGKLIFDISITQFILNNIFIIDEDEDILIINKHIINEDVYNEFVNIFINFNELNDLYFLNNQSLNQDEEFKLITNLFFLSMLTIIKIEFSDLNCKSLKDDVENYYIVKTTSKTIKG